MAHSMESTMSACTTSSDGVWEARVRRSTARAGRGARVAIRINEFILCGEIYGPGDKFGSICGMRPI